MVLLDFEFKAGMAILHGKEWWQQGQSARFVHLLLFAQAIAHLFTGDGLEVFGCLQHRKTVDSSGCELITRTAADEFGGGLTEGNAVSAGKYLACPQGIIFEVECRARDFMCAQANSSHFSCERI
jgi:hypothetical protein